MYNILDFNYNLINFSFKLKYIDFKLLYNNFRLIFDNFKLVYDNFKLLDMSFDLINIIYDLLNSEFLMMIVVLVLIIATIIAAINDFKYKIISNKLTFSLIIFGILINLIFSIILKNTIFIKDSIIFGLITFLSCYILWKFRLWGGGDVKLFTAIATVLPIHPTLNTNILNYFNFEILNLAFNKSIINFPLIVYYPFPFTVIFNSILLSFPFLFLFVIFNYTNNIGLKKPYLNQKSLVKLKSFVKLKNLVNLKNLVKLKNFANLKNLLNLKSSVKLKSLLNLKNFKLNLKDLFQKIKNSELNLKGLNKNSRLNFLNKLKTKNLLVSLIFSLLFSLIFSFISFSFDNLKDYPDILFTILTGALCGLFFSSIIGYLINKFRKIVKRGSIKIVNVKDLKEGMILEKTIIKEDNLRFNKDNKDNDYILNICCDLKELGRENNLDIENNGKRYVLQTKTVAGLYQKDLHMLNELANKNFLEKSLKIKITVPFAPSIAIGLITAIFIGDISNLFFILINNAL